MLWKAIKWIQLWFEGDDLANCRCVSKNAGDLFAYYLPKEDHLGNILCTQNSEGTHNTYDKHKPQSVKACFSHKLCWPNLHQEGVRILCMSWKR